MKINNLKCIYQQDIFSNVSFCFFLINTHVIARIAEQKFKKVVKSYPENHTRESLPCTARRIIARCPSALCTRT